MQSRILMVASAAIFLVAGALHLYGTLFDDDLSPRDPALRTRMREVSPVITDETTMWRAWIGFNVGFGMGAMLHGLLYAFLAIGHSRLLFGSRYLIAVGLAMTGGFCALSRVILFRIPFLCFGASLACYVASIVLSRAAASSGPAAEGTTWPR